MLRHRKIESDDEVPLLTDDNYSDKHAHLWQNFSTTRTNAPHQEGTPFPPLVGFFVVCFDTRHGNTVEWSSVAEGLNLQGLEFKALPSGAHTTTSDFVIFKQFLHYGAALYRTIPDEYSDRGAVFKSVGVLCHRYQDLWAYRGILENSFDHIIHHPEDAEKLLAPSNGNVAYDVENGNIVSVLEEIHAIGNKVSVQNDGILKFVNHFGVNIFRLWKLVLLGKRILFLSGPPVEELCQQALCCFLLGSRNAINGRRQDSQLLLYVDLHDLDLLRRTESYIACSTEQIFVDKQEIYDVVVAHGEINIVDENVRKICGVTTVDEERYRDVLADLTFRLREPQPNSSSSASYDALAACFGRLNDSIFDSLLRAEQTASATVTAEHMRDMSLHPRLDFQFLQHIVARHGIRVLVEDERWCPQ